MVPVLVALAALSNPIARSSEPLCVEQTPFEVLAPREGDEVGSRASLWVVEHSRAPIGLSKLPELFDPEREQPIEVVVTRWRTRQGALTRLQPIDASGEPGLRAQAYWVRTTDPITGGVFDHPFTVRDGRTELSVPDLTDDPTWIEPDARCEKSGIRVDFAGAAPQGAFFVVHAGTSTLAASAEAHLEFEAEDDVSLAVRMFDVEGGRSPPTATFVVERPTSASNTPDGAFGCACTIERADLWDSAVLAALAALLMGARTRLQRLRSMERLRRAALLDRGVTGSVRRRDDAGVLPPIE